MESERPAGVAEGVGAGRAGLHPAGPSVSGRTVGPDGTGEPAAAPPGVQRMPDGVGGAPGVADRPAAPPLPSAVLDGAAGPNGAPVPEPSTNTAATVSEAAAVEFDRVTKTYPTGMTALRDVSLRIAPGEFVFVVGRTGMGKSTLMKMIYREELPTAGRVWVQGTDVTTLPASRVPFLRRRLGVVFQDFKLLPRKTAWENVAFALEVTAAPKSEIAPRVDEALEVVGLAPRADALPGQLSAGEQQRVSIARALVHDPSLLLADEPTGNLDPESSWEIVHLLSRINRGGTTVVVATHDKVIVDAVRHRVVALQAGAIVRDQAYGSYDGQ